MTLPIPVAEFIISECRDILRGADVLCVGKQALMVTPRTLDALLARFSLTNQCSDPPEFDKQTIASKIYKGVTANWFFRSLGANSVQSIDVTDYEGAEIVHDLCRPIPEHHHKSFDLIYVGQVFVTLFNPSVAIINLSKMLRPGGKIIFLESMFPGRLSYVKLSPNWFKDYFGINRYASCNILAVDYIDDMQFTIGPWPVKRIVDDPKDDRLIMLGVAEKTALSSDELMPVTAQYRTNALPYTVEAGPDAPALLGNNLVPDNFFNPIVPSHKWHPCDHHPLVHSTGWHIDGWIDLESAIMLPAGDAGNIIIKGMTPLVDNPAFETQMNAKINGASVSTVVRLGEWEITVPVDRAATPRKLELSFAAAQQLPTPDKRQIAAMIRGIEFRE